MEPETIKVERVEKKWGYEIWLVNNEKYCGKILHFKKGHNFSMHYHLEKDESWYVLKGSLNFKWIETTTGSLKDEILTEGSARRIPIGLPHQLYALEDTDVIETSTQHFETDSYRLYRGDCICCSV
jgi:mannose-6-phosphate isomerase-like protein (cupin superfamily)